MLAWGHWQIGMKLELEARGAALGGHKEAEAVRMPAWGCASLRRESQWRGLLFEVSSIWNSRWQHVTVKILINYNSIKLKIWFLCATSCISNAQWPLGAGGCPTKQGRNRSYAALWVNDHVEEEEKTSLKTHLAFLELNIGMEKDYLLNKRKELSRWRLLCSFKFFVNYSCVSTSKCWQKDNT